VNKFHAHAQLRSRLQLAFLSAGLLTGCAAYESEFQCKAPVGMPCRSLQAVYNAETAIPALPPVPDPTRNLSSEIAEQWTPPVKTVWIAPYVDSAGRRHEASILRLIVFSGTRAVTAEPEFLLPPIPDTTDSGESIAPPQPPPAPTPHITPGRPQGQNQPSIGIPPELTPGLFTPPTPQGGKPSSGFGLPGY
jgi:hypothetical protein